MQIESTIKRRPRLRDEVRNRILKMIRENGMRPGDRLLSEKKLGQSFSVNHLTIRAALSDLEENGVVERRPGSGTFLTHSLNAAENQSPASGKLAVIALREAEHLFSIIRNAIVHELEKDGYMCMSSSISKDPVIMVEQLCSFQEKGLSTLIFDNTLCIYPEIIDFLNSPECKYKKIVRVLGNGSITGDLPGNEVTIDYVKAYRDAVTLLKNLGHRRIAFFCGSNDPDYDCGEANKKYVQLYTSAMIENDLADFIMVRTGTEDHEFNQAVEELLNAQERPTAIITDMDYRCVKLLERAKELNIKVPEDLSLIGFNDTPWSEHFDVSTFRFRFKEIGEAVAKVLSSPDKTNKIVVPIDYINKKTVAPAK